MSEKRYDFSRVFLDGDGGGDREGGGQVRGFRPETVIDRTYPLEQIVEAQRYVETGEKAGSAVVVV